MFGLDFTIRTDADIEAIQHAVSNARDPNYLENCKKEKDLRREAKFSGAVHEPQVPVSHEDLFEDETCVETGYSWEALVFWGTVSLDDLDPSYPLMLTKWPSFLHSTEYLRRRGWKSSMTRYLVPMKYVLNLRRQDFWNQVHGNANALLIKKVVGSKIDCPHSKIDEYWNASDSSEGTWSTDDQRSQGPIGSSRVSRIRSGLTIEDPSDSRANASRRTTQTDHQREP